MRDTLSKCLVQAALDDPRTLLLTGDHGYALFDEFRQKCPDRYINAGIAEQNMIGMAAGLSRSGFRPIIYGLSAFVPVRVLEQIKLDLAHDNLPALLLGDGAGFVYSQLGTSHQSTEDIACVRAIPQVPIYSPADAEELRVCFENALAYPGTAYLRIGKADRPAVHTQALSSYRAGDIIRVSGDANATLQLLATGSMVSTAINVAKTLSDTAVWSVPTIKPLNHDQVASVAADSQAVICLEEHSIFGGLGSAVCEILSDRAPTRVVRIGVRDRFSHYCGSYDYLLHEHGLTEAAVREQIVNALGLA